MIILVGSKISKREIFASLGKPEYSYFFLMKDFLPVLERIGTVIQVHDLTDIESHYASYHDQGEDVVFVSFSPPHQTPLNLPCPTVTLFAWEFDSLPSVAWDGNPQNDWRYVFANISGAIATSREAAGLVQQSMGEEFPVLALPAPVWDRYAALHNAQGWSLELSERTFLFSGTIIDSPILGLSADGLVRRPEPEREPLEPFLEEGPELLQSQPSDRFAAAWQLSIALAKGWWGEVFSTPALSGQADLMSISEPEPTVARPVAHSVSVRGVVYTSVLNPADGRKNWVDLITAFCWAFKEVEDATLIVKMTHHDLEFYRIVLITLLSRLAPFRCRVIVLHGFLEDDQYQALISASSYYVNASSCEGLCLPLMEFLASGKPAIAPDHTAMADYLDGQLAFVLSYGLEPTCWPHDPTGMLLTHKHRLNWQSLMEAFRASYRQAKHEPARYQTMSENACQKLKVFASVDSVNGPLKAFLQRVIENHDEQTSVCPVGSPAG